MEVWVNPACSKCRAATAELDARGVTYTTRRYLDDPPSEAELVAALDALGMQPWELARTGDALAGQLGLTGLPRDAATRDEWIRLLAANPALIQRPVLLAADGTAYLGRDAEGIASAVAHDQG